MRDEWLKDILKQADDRLSCGAPPLPANLSQHVQAALARRRRQRMLLPAAAAVVLIAFTASLWLADGLQHTPQLRANSGGMANSGSPDTDLNNEFAARQEATDALRREAARLGREADSRLAVVRRTAALLREQKQARLVNAQPPSETVLAPELRARLKTEEAACVLVQYADRLRLELQLEAQARAQYEEVLRLFPETRWARVARERLEESEAVTGEST